MSLFKKEKKLSTDSIDNGVGLITVTQPTSTIAEQFRTVRTNIQFSSVDKDMKIIMATSSGPSEGKSTVITNLAVTYANQGLKVLLIDADMRRPTAHQTFGLSNETGLTNCLTEKNIDIAKAVEETPIENLYVMPAGPTPPNPSELLNTKRMDSLLIAVAEQMDMVIIDTPPLISVTDAQIVATKVDGTILVVRSGVANKGAVVKAKELLDTVHARIIGTILNDVSGSDESGYYGGYYGYYK